MGGLSSKHVEEAVDGTPDTDRTSKRTHILEVDPRSPSDYITRTPIAVSNSPNKNHDQTPCGNKVVKTLPDDPRSPSTEVSRTPICIETRDKQKRPVTMRPSRLTQLESSSSSSSEASSSSDEPDPRSPTSKVPRTPLENKEHVFSEPEEIKEKDADRKEQEPTEVTEKIDSTCVKDSSAEKKIPVPEADNATDKLQIRRPLGTLQSNGVNSTPRGILQAKQCRNVEEEYSKSQQIIMSQLNGQEKKVASSTQFVESI